MARGLKKSLFRLVGFLEAIGSLSFRDINSRRFKRRFEIMWAEEVLAEGTVFSLK